MSQPVGTHWIADLGGIDPGLLADAPAIEALLLQAAREAKAQVLFSHLHAFGPGQGVTGVVLLAESHISIHTWPERGFAALDIFMCKGARPGQAYEALRSAFAPQSAELRVLERAL
jgi:S-adenosylmethionine decarboxylase